MGTPAPIENPGDQCSLCWGPNKTYPGTATPLYITVEFAGIEKGPIWVAAAGEPLNGRYTVEQVIGGPCEWFFFEAGVVYLEVGYAFTKLRSQISNTAGYVQFIGLSVDDCGKECSNFGTGWFIGGTCKVDWTDTI